ncbi:MAG: formate dehydrogenase accessory sulfurtransferase FdhD, partial [Duodenibacillus sp.]
MREFARVNAPQGAAASNEPMTGARRVVLHRFKSVAPVTDFVAEEVPVALVYNGLSHVVMMASPMELEAFALGFTLAERIVPDASHVYGIEVREGCHGGFEVALDISSECFWKLKQRRRAMEGRTGCGICGVESLEEAV